MALGDLDAPIPKNRMFNKCAVCDRNVIYGDPGDSVFK